MRLWLLMLWCRIRIRRCVRCGEVGRHREFSYTVLGNGILCPECLSECCL